MSIIESIKEHFKLPIDYLENKNKLDSTLILDLELNNTNTEESTKIKESANSSEYSNESINYTTGIYNYVFNPETVCGKEVLKLWSNYFTTDENFLIESQKLYNTYKSPNKTPKYNCSDIIDQWDELIENTYFKEKFGYVEWSYLDKLNHSAYFLEFISIYNLMSPIISFLIPIILLIIPFCMLKMQGISINFEQYYKVLKEVLQNHAFGQILFHFKSASLNKKFYILLSFAFYVYQIYQNIQICASFYKNMKLIHIYLFKLNNYLNYTILHMNNYIKYSKKYKTYTSFNDSITHNLHILTDYKNEIEKISLFKPTYKKVFEIGYVMKCFYKLHSLPKYKKAFIFSFGFNGYIDNINGLCTNLNNTKMNCCKYTKKKCSFKNIYYPALVNNNPIKNTYNLNKKLIITGPNAAGKTTLLKSTIINIILSQQLGCGFYKTAKIVPYDFIHCYLNIPDTSGRDSLFQAEARRCKDIIDLIVDNTNKKHFCIFDELYSGTNPYEAIGSAYSFLEYLTKYQNVDFMLTTHYIDLCTRLQNNKLIQNYYMKIDSSNNQIKYTYLLDKGISKIKGGIKVLDDLNYPDEIIKNTKEILNDLTD